MEKKDKEEEEEPAVSAEDAEVNRAAVTLHREIKRAERKKTETEAAASAREAEQLVAAQALLRQAKYLEALAIAGQEGTTYSRLWATLRYGCHVRLKQFDQVRDQRARRKKTLFFFFFCLIFFVF
jgi:hypothetical protein